MNLNSKLLVRMREHTVNSQHSAVDLSLKMNRSTSYLGQLWETGCVPSLRTVQIFSEALQLDANQRMELVELQAFSDGKFPEEIREKAEVLTALGRCFSVEQLQALLEKA